MQQMDEDSQNISEKVNIALRVKGRSLCLSNIQTTVHHPHLSFICPQQLNEMLTFLSFTSTVTVLLTVTNANEPFWGTAEAFPHNVTRVEKKHK